MTPRRIRLFYDTLGAPGNLALVLLFVVPLVLVVLFSFGTVNIVGRPRFGTTLGNYREVVEPYFVPVVLRTLWYAAVTTAICVLFGYPVAYLITRFARRFGRVVILAIILTWLVDYLVRIYAWQSLLSDDGVVNSILHDLGVGSVQLLPSTFAVLAGLVYGYFPLMVLPIYASLSDLDPSLIEAGKDLYGSPWQTFRHVTLPATLPGVVGGVIITFFPVLGDFATAQFLGGPNQSMIGNVIYEQFIGQGGSLTFASALTVVLLLVLVIGLAAGALLFRRGLRLAIAGPGATS